MEGGFEEPLVYSGSDNSDGEDAAKSDSHLSSFSERPTQHESSEKQVSRNSDEDDDLNISIVKSRKIARILSSGDEDENENANKNSKNKFEAMREENSTESSSHIRSTIYDSDTKSSSDGNRSDKEVLSENTIKKLKKKKVKVQKKSTRFQSDSESDADSSTKIRSKNYEKNNKKPKRTSSQLSGGDSPDSDSSALSNDQKDDDGNVKPREKLVQRMSAKMAEQQMKEIQSESQRMARQLHVNIPYHKPKQHSLKEFLSRRSIVHQQEKLSQKPILKAAVAIKMSNEELIQYMDDLKKRIKEAEEFFQEQEEEAPTSFANDSYDSTENSDKDDDKVNTSETPQSAKKLIECEENDHSEDHQPCNNTSIEDESINHSIIGNDKQITEPNKANTAADVILVHTIPTELDHKLDALPTLNKIKPTDHVPKLKGGSGFIIDLETNDLRKTPKTGVDELFSRFVKNAIVKTNLADTQNFGIFHTDTGSIERHTVHVNLNDSKPKREPRPGESLFELRNKLSLKIREKREQLIAQRLQEEKDQELQCKQMESEDDMDFDDLSVVEKCYAPEETEDGLKEDTEHNIDEDEQIEKMDDNKSYDENIQSSEESDSDSDDLKIDGTLVENGEIRKPRKRILTTLDDDSDNEISQQDPTNTIASDDNGMQHTDNPTITQSDETSKSISALESEILQLSDSTNATSSKKVSAKLFEDCNNEEDISESQLMALCSGSFATQYLENESFRDVESVQMNASNKLGTEDKSVKIVQNKPAFLLSDEEESNEAIFVEHKSKNKRKKHVVIYSDDENDSCEGEPQQHEEQKEAETGDEDSRISIEKDQESIVDEEEPEVKYIEYDSDENEVEVQLKKSDVRQKASEFFEKEAELSESEWGSDDEEESEINRYEIEVGDEDKFDKNKLRDELERIRLREQTDQDAREIRILTERFIEEEDNGQERERKFRWKHLNNGENNEGIENVDEELPDTQNSDDENETEWRLRRYEREKLLKEKTANESSTIEQTSVTLEMLEQTTIESTINSSKRISIIKPISVVSSKTASPFLMARADLHAVHHSRKSFLNRDSPILEKLVCLSKAGNDNDPILNTVKGKGNYVFIATDKKDSSKRKSENEAEHMEAINPCKKSKLDTQKSGQLRPQTKAFFDSLS